MISRRVRRFILLTLLLLSSGAIVGLAALRARPGRGDAPPPGYSSVKMLQLAFVTKQLALVDLDLPVPPTMELEQGIEYGSGGDVSLKLDLYAPKEVNKPVPGLIFIHGGGWQKGGREDYRFYCIKFAERGFVVASISYRLRNVAQYPAAVEDVKCAVRWMRANAESFGIDPDRIAVIGGSAGGHLSMMIGYTSDVPELEGSGGHGEVSSRVQAVVNLYGPVDLTTPYARSHELVTEFMGHQYDDAKQKFVEASPLHYITRDDPPTLILHGTLDDLVPIKQADMLAAALKEAGVPYEYERLEGWPHTMDLAQVVNDYCLRRIHEFLILHLVEPSE